METSPQHDSLLNRARSRSSTRLKLLPRDDNIFRKRDYIVGIALLLVVVVLWTSSNFITQDMFDAGYEKPFLVTYLNTSAFAFYLIPVIIRLAWKRKARQGVSIREGYQELSQETHYDTPHIQSALDAPLTMRETARIASWFCLLWFIANWTVNASLNYTSVASATILSSMSGFFTLGIGRVFRVEQLTGTKFIAVFISFIGVLLVSLSDSSSMSESPALVDASTMHPLFGDFLALVSAVFYALYVILLKVQIKAESRIDMQLFFGFVGLFNILACWPIGVFLHGIGAETLELPSSGKVVAALLINMFITWSSDFLYVLAMLKTTPLVVTIGLSLTIPFAVLGDFALGNLVQFQVIFGALLVFIGFVVVGTDHSNVDQELEESIEVVS
ncbi:hypothetical protein CPB85DRAFT_1427743 [Mucidula mucida]|nr:hypothetical protein CPB85DRAFT_1427743 [Mucidula mucida]